MKKLLTEYGYNHIPQYYQMVAESYVNGQKEQAKSQFKAMPRSAQKEMVGQIIFVDSLYVGDNDTDKMFFFDLL